MRKKLCFLLLLLLTTTLMAWSADQLISVTGTVVDESGEPLIGCSVQLKGSQVGTVADLEGHFKMQVPQGATLVFSYRLQDTGDESIALHACHDERGLARIK